ncbi:hypothetical protein CDN99_24095 [Roseateles aquatilis]|uniref:Ig-like domain-containing protein n=1 Tax=Roseateles aquatilis TaxID=431061 RepID=A0A246IW03_9BURK|nr:hypothetical protein CDN99_24095 [Roseateles aquatilis]
MLAAVSVFVAACGGGGEDTASVRVKSASSDAPVIATQPANASVLTGGTATFTVSATGTGLGYQWKKNGVAIPSATSEAYTTPAVSYVDHGALYTVEVSSTAGSVTSTAAQLTLALSANQQAFESTILAPAAGSHFLHWNLPYAGTPTSGTHYAYSDFAVIPASPLTNGPQLSAQSAPSNIASTLALLTPGPTRVLKNGAILVVPAPNVSNKVSYVGSDVRVDTIASDNVTVAYAEIRSNYETVALTGTLAATPDDVARFHNSFFSNPAILDTTRSYAAGAGYLKFTQTNSGDRYNAFDCTTATTGAAVTPCRTGTTLNNVLTTGISSTSDGVTYRLADGVVGTVGGVSVWVANNPRPRSATLSSTVQYRIYFQLNGNVYTGALIKDGTVLGGSYYVSNPNGATVNDRLTFLPFDIRLNKAAHDSLVAAMKI